MENAGPGFRGTGSRGVENTECGKHGVWKTRVWWKTRGLSENTGELLFRPTMKINQRKTRFSNIIIKRIKYFVRKKTIQMPTCRAEVFSRGYSQKKWVWVGPASQNPYPIYDQICDIPYLIYDLTKTSKPF